MMQINIFSYLHKTRLNMIASKLSEIADIQKRLNEYARIGLGKTLWGEAAKLGIELRYLEIAILKELKP